MQSDALGGRVGSGVTVNVSSGAEVATDPSAVTAASVAVVPVIGMTSVSPATGVAVSAGAWWSLPAPLLMSWLLLKVSGVALLEKDIADRRPAYESYIKSTPAFIPWLPRK